MSGRVVVSDHALVRFIERVKGVSLDGYRAEAAAMLSAGSPPTVAVGEYDDGYLFVVDPTDPPTIVTVLMPGWLPKRRRGWTPRILVHVPPHPVPTSQGET